MRILSLFRACFLVAFSLGASLAHAGVLIEVDKSTQRMQVSVDGKERYSWPVSTGLTRYSTPRGNYTPFRLEEDHRSREWDNAPMPHSIFFTGRGHAIHGSDAVRNLGSPASHGCVRLSRANAATLFALVREEGLNDTKIVIRGDEQIAMARKAPKTRTVAREPAAERRVVQAPAAERRVVRQATTERRQVRRSAPDPFWSDQGYAPARRSSRQVEPFYAPMDRGSWW
jgi:hypothetical protein